MKFAIEYPQARLNTPLRQFAEVFKHQNIFFNLLFEVLDEEGIKWRKVKYNRKAGLARFANDEIYLAYHKCNNHPRAYTIKEGYTLHEMYFDKTGYSGWAEMSNNKALFEKTQKVDLNEANVFLKSYLKKYEEIKLSKYEQNIRNSLIPIGKKGIVLVALQIPNDTVSELADIQTYQLARDVIKVYNDLEYYPVIKPHPHNKKFSSKQLGEGEFHITRDPIYSLLKNAKAVYTVNSGVGFEALLYGKPVFTSGKSDYHWVTNRVKNIEDIRRTKGKFDVDQDKIVKFLYFLLDKYFITYNDKEKIRRKILEITGNV